MGRGGSRRSPCEQREECKGVYTRKPVSPDPVNHACLSERELALYQCKPVSPQTGEPMDGYGEGGRRSRPCEPGLAGWYGLAARAIQVCDVQENDFLLETARSQAWLAGLAWPRAPSTFAMYRKNELL